MIFQIVLAAHICLCLFLIGVVLVQQGSGADAGVTFGGGSNTVFGASGATNLFTRITTITCIAFMVTSIIMVKNYPSLLKANSTPEDAATSQPSVMDVVDPNAIPKDLEGQTVTVDQPAAEEGAAKAVEAAAGEAEKAEEAVEETAATSETSAQEEQPESAPAPEAEGAAAQ